MVDDIFDENPVPGIGIPDEKLAEAVEQFTGTSAPLAEQVKKTRSNKKSVDVSVQSVRCPKCGSTSRTKYFGAVITRELKGITPDGKPYNSITWRRCRCLKCKQLRVEKHHDNF